MIIIGTSHFVSFESAVRYYRPYLGDPAYKGDGPCPIVRRRQKDEENRQIVQRKLDGGEIYIGKPDLRPGETLSVNQEEGRYFITTP